MVSLYCVLKRLHTNMIEHENSFILWLKRKKCCCDISLGTKIFWNVIVTTRTITVMEAFAFLFYSLNLCWKITMLNVCWTFPCPMFVRLVTNSCISAFCLPSVDLPIIFNSDPLKTMLRKVISSILTKYSSDSYYMTVMSKSINDLLIECLMSTRNCYFMCELCILGTDSE